LDESIPSLPARQQEKIKKIRNYGIKLETLLLAINPTQPIETQYGVSPFNSDVIREVLPNLWVKNLDQLKIFDNFIRKSLKIRKVYDTILSSQVYQYFAAVAPGIKELITQDIIIKALSRDPEFQRKYFDIIVVDSPATGHGLSWFSVPDAVITTFPIGPLNKKAREIKKIWSDAQQTSIHLATLPEEMPVNETIEFYTSLSQKLKLPVKTILLNSIFPKLSAQPTAMAETAYSAPNYRDYAAQTAHLEDSISDIFPYIQRSAQFYQNRRQLNEMYKQILVQKIPLPLLELPVIFQKKSSRSLIEQLGKMV